MPSTNHKIYLPGETKEQRKARKKVEKSKQQVEETLPVESSFKKNYVACLKWGDKYSADYVNKLDSMVRRNCTIDYEFVCFTENTNGINEHIQTFPLPKLKADGWWYKPMFLGSDLPIKGTLLFLDLDVVVFENINKLFTFQPDKFVICRDFNRSIREKWDRMNSSVFRTPIGKYDKIWQEFQKNTKHEVERNRGDQDWMFRHIKDHVFWPDEWIMSYKWEMRDRRDLRIDTITRKRNFILDAPPRIKKDTSVAVFHGDPNPADANDTWTKKHWG